MANEAEKMFIDLEVQVSPEQIQQGQKKMDAYAASAVKAATAVDKTSKSIEKSGKAAQVSGQQFSKFTASIEALSSKGVLVNHFGNNIAMLVNDIATLSRELDMRQAAEKYIQAVGKSDAASRAWSNAIYKAESANVRFGRSVATAMLPVMEDAAKVAERVAYFAEKNPELVKFAVGSGASMAALVAAANTTQMVLQAAGGIMQIPGKIGEAGKILKEFFAPIGASFDTGAAATQAAAATTMVAAATAQNAAADKQLAAALAAKALTGSKIAGEVGGAVAGKVGGVLAGGVGGAAAGGSLRLAALAQGNFVTALNPSAAIESGSAELMSFASANQVAAAAAQQSAAATQAANAAKMSAGLPALGIAAAALGGVVAGLIGSDLLAKSGANESKPVKALDDFLGSKTGGLLNFQFQSFEDLGNLAKGFFTIWASGIGVIHNISEDFLRFTYNGFVEFTASVAKMMGDMFGGNLVGRGDKAAAAVRAGAEGFVLYGKRMTDHAREYGIEAGILAGVFEDGAKKAKDASPAWGQAVEAYIQFTKENEAASNQYDTDLYKADQDTLNQITTLETNYNTERIKAVTDFNKTQQDALTEFNASQGKALYDFYAGQAKETLTHNSQRQKDILAFDAQEADTEFEANRQRGKNIQAFKDEDTKSEADYYANRLTAVEEFGAAAVDAEAEHQKTMRRMKEDGADEIDELSRSRDALGIVKALRRQEKERSRAEEDYLGQKAQGEGQQAKRLADMEEQFQKERKARADDFEKRNQEADDEAKYQKNKRKKEFDEKNKVADDEFKADQDAREVEFKAEQGVAAWEFGQRQNKEATAFNLLQGQRKTQYDTELEKLKYENGLRKDEITTAYNAEKIARATRFKEQLDQLDASLLNHKQIQEDYQEKMSKSFGEFLDNMDNQISGGGTYVAPELTKEEKQKLAQYGYYNDNYTTYDGKRASGGYANYGKYTLGELGSEFVVNANATHQAESLIGARLSQESLIAGLVSGRSGGASVNLGGITISGGGDAETIALRASQIVYAKVKDGVRKANAQRTGSRPL